MTSYHQAAPQHNARTDLVLNLLRRALDPATLSGEAENAANKFVTIARREKIDYPAFVAAIIAVSHRIAPPVEEIPEPKECGYLMPFGKWKGQSLGHIASLDPAYLRWASQNLNDGWIREAAGVVWGWVEETK